MAYIYFIKPIGTYFNKAVLYAYCVYEMDSEKKTADDYIHCCLIKNGDFIYTIHLQTLVRILI